jgi:hypothetical protein
MGKRSFCEGAFSEGTFAARACISAILAARPFTGFGESPPLAVSAGLAAPFDLLYAGTVFATMIPRLKMYPIALVLAS